MAGGSARQKKAKTKPTTRNVPHGGATKSGADGEFEELSNQPDDAARAGKNDTIHPKETSEPEVRNRHHDVDGVDEPPLFSAGCRVKRKGLGAETRKELSSNGPPEVDAVHGTLQSSSDMKKLPENDSANGKRKKSKTWSEGESESKDVATRIEADEEEANEEEGDRVEEMVEEDEEGGEGDNAASRKKSISSVIKLRAVPKTFESLGIDEWLLKTLHELNIRHPTPVQYGCIPAILEGKNVIGMAETGSGKTAAFALPILQRLAKDPYGIFAIVLTPTRELAVQISDQFRAFGSTLNLRDAVIIGGLDLTTQSQELAKRPHIVIATPGRLMDHLTSDESVPSIFSRAQFLVLDEADRLLDTSFANEMRVIFNKVPKKRQTLLFSATMTPNIQAVEALAQGDNFFRFDACEKAKTVSSLNQSYVFVPENVKDVYLYYLLRKLFEEEENIRSCIVFTSTCKSCHYLSLLLTELGISNAQLHSLKQQKERFSALQSFRAAQTTILIATDVASRGLDIPTVDLVINYDIPRQPRDYIHRVGRTARAGRKGKAINIITQYDVELVQNIESLIEKKLSEFELNEDHVLKEITKVFKAKKVVTLKIFESGFDDLVKRKKEMKKENRKAAAA